MFSFSFSPSPPPSHEYAMQLHIVLLHYLIAGSIGGHLIGGWPQKTFLILLEDLN